jgi:hypothetical protein
MDPHMADIFYSGFFLPGRADLIIQFVAYAVPRAWHRF